MGSLWFLSVLNGPAQTQASVTLAWSPSPSSAVAGYKLYRGLASQTYDTAVSVGNVTNATLSDLALGTTYFFAATAVDSSGLESGYSNEVSYSVPTNAPPTISSIADQNLVPDTATAPLAFTVGDAETPATNLVLLGDSSNLSLVPNANITLGGSGTNRTVTVAPATGQTGTATITLTVSDGSLSATTSFLLTVDRLPTVTLTAPVGGATYVEPASILLAADVTANNHMILKVQFYNGTLLLNEVAAAPYSWTWNNVLAGSYSLSARAVYDSGKSVSSSSAAVTVVPVPPIPAPWVSADMGSVNVAGSASFSSAIYTVSGAGNIGGRSDSFRFVYQSLSGDGEIKAQVSSVQNTGGSARIGLMIRENLTSKSRDVFVGIASDGACEWQRRTSTGGGASVTGCGVLTPPNAYLRLVRTANVVTAHLSIDGTNWTLAASGSVSMAANIYMGLVVASGSVSTLNTATFAQVEAVP